jgi:small GTP-binding protein
MSILDERYSKLVLEEKALLESLSAEIKTLSHEGLEDRLRALRENLENLFSIVFIGEFSTGKSSIINALLGKRILPEGITPTTDRITILRHGDLKEEYGENGNHYISIPEDRLKGFFIVDTPGTNVTIEQHEQITQGFIPKADIVFFVIGAERALTGSEARLIRFIKEEWLKNIVFLLNKTDIVESEEELKGLIRYSEGEIERIFRIKPFLIPVSARLALKGKESGDFELYSRSGMGRLEEYIFETLGEEERVRMRIRGSSEFALDLCAETERVLTDNLDGISRDTERLEEFEMRLEGIKEGILENSNLFTERIRGRLLEFKTRGIEFIDELIRFDNVFKLLRKERIAREFESRVSSLTVKELEKDLEDMVLWAERSSRTLMDSAIDFYRGSIQPVSLRDSTGFASGRIRLIDTVRSELEMRQKQIDPSILGGNIVDSARGAVASVLGVQVGSLAIGAAVVSAFSSLVVDVTGILTTIAIMATAFAILPKKRRDAMREFSAKIDTLIGELTGSISSQFERNLNGIKMQILDSLIPLKNFYSTQEKKLLESKKRVGEIKEGFEGIKGKVS